MLLNFLTLFYISDQPQNVFIEGHICDQIVQGL